LSRWQVALGSAQGGHSSPVQALVMVGPFLFSADWDGDIKVQRPNFDTCLRKGWGSTFHHIHLKEGIESNRVCRTSAALLRDHVWRGPLRGYAMQLSFFNANGDGINIVCRNSWQRSDQKRPASYAAEPCMNGRQCSDGAVSLAKPMLKSCGVACRYGICWQGTVCRPLLRLTLMSSWASFNGRCTTRVLCLCRLKLRVR
jgi:hypothetical protein